ncbi:arylesterase [Glaciimonas sp. PCH181]|uniref:arylesterase n=1 Tax=Glaciimonas sp. PCH181 TaxID=2133943 RepID=UPI000D3AA628|nr:arylesterase [Glaciimonas sp. PCH181]PUA18520.1 arylesterase [Glaciimonas sp. PCH181]
MRIISRKCGNIIRRWREQPSLTANRSGKINRISRRNVLLTSLISVLAAFGTLSSTSAHSASKSILVLGDSLSAEYGLARGTGWVALLQQRLQTQHSDITVTNASISGETTSGGNTRLPALLKQRPNIVIIELGANDALRGLQLKATESNLRTMIAAAQKAHAKVLLVGMRIPPNYGRDYTEKFFGLYSTVAQQTKVALVPFLLEDIANKSALFQADRIHPIAEAHPTMLNNVWQKLQPLIKN